MGDSKIEMKSTYGQADPYVPPQCSESLERLCTCWGQAVPFCLKVGIAEAAAADAGKPHCTDEVCYMRSGCTSTTWGGGTRCQESPRPAMSEYEYSWKYQAHLKQFLRRTSRFRSYATQEYANDDDRGYFSDEVYPSDGEPIVPWNPVVDYAGQYLHQPWCR